jgi:hypothetical protein
VRIIVDVPEPQLARATCYTVTSYVRAVLKVGALRQELAKGELEVPMTRPGCYEIPVHGADQRGAQVVRILGTEREGEALRGRLIEQANRELARLER